MGSQGVARGRNATPKFTHYGRNVSKMDLKHNFATKCRHLGSQNVFKNAYKINFATPPDTWGRSFIWTTIVMYQHL